MHVLNFLPKRQSVVSTDQGEGATIAAAAVQELTVPAKEVLIGASVANLDGGPQFLTSTGFDLTQAGSVDLLVAPDYNGKPDIRVVAVGFVTPAPVEPVPASALAPFSAPATQKQAEAIRKNSLACVKTALADLEAMQRGPNNIPNADAIQEGFAKAAPGAGKADYFAQTSCRSPGNHERASEGGDQGSAKLGYHIHFSNLREKGDILVTKRIISC
jgi:hypothetical protein